MAALQIGSHMHTKLSRSLRISVGMVPVVKTKQERKV